MTSQKLWLDSVLTNNDKKWVIVTTHLPFYSTNIKRDNPHIRRNFQPILEKHGVDLVLTGHDHAYGRGVVSDNKDVKPSIVYVVSVSGPKLYEAGDKTWMQKRGGNLQLFQKITINGDVLDFKAVAADGEVFDHFILKKGRQGNKLVEQKID
jgi:3',5'-cyclic AMP phosphodiesterase CpdA